MTPMADSLSLSHSLFLSLSLTHSLSLSLSLTFSITLFLSLSHSHTLTLSPSLALPLSRTLSPPLSPSLSLPLSLPLSPLSLPLSHSLYVSYPVLMLTMMVLSFAPSLVLSSVRQQISPTSWRHQSNVFITIWRVNSHTQSAWLWCDTNSDFIPP